MAEGMMLIERARAMYELGRALTVADGQMKPVTYCEKHGMSENPEIARTAYRCCVVAAMSWKEARKWLERLKADERELSRCDRAEAKCRTRADEIAKIGGFEESVERARALQESLMR